MEPKLARSVFRPWSQARSSGETADSPYRKSCLVGHSNEKPSAERPKAASERGRTPKARSGSRSPTTACGKAGQFYYGLVGGRPASRQFDEEQLREGPTDYILLRSGLKKPVRSLQPDGSYHLTKLGKSFFRDKYTEWLAHVPVRITGTRQRGRNAGRAYMREDFLPVTVVNGSLSRQSSGLSDAQAHARVKAAARQLGNPNDGDPIMELSQETYRYDANRDWAFSTRPCRPSTTGRRRRSPCGSPWARCRKSPNSSG